MAKGGDNIILWLLLLGGGLFYIYHRHDTKEDNGTGPTKTPAAGAGPHRFRPTALPPHNHTSPVVIPPSGGFAVDTAYCHVHPDDYRCGGSNHNIGGTGGVGFGDCPSCPPGGMQESSYFTYAPGDRVNSWFDANSSTGMYAVPSQESYGDVGAIF